MLFEGHLCEVCIFKFFLAAKVLTFRVVTNRNLTLPMQTLPSSKTQKHFNLSVKKEKEKRSSVAKKNESRGGGNE